MQHIPLLIPRWTWSVITDLGMQSINSKHTNCKVCFLISVSMPTPIGTVITIAGKTNNTTLYEYD